MNKTDASTEIKRLEEITRHIGNYRSRMAGTICPYTVYECENIISEDINEALDILKKICWERNMRKVFTKEELSYYDGTNGKPAYAAVEGIVYDVSLEPTWGGASHFGLLAGKDVTEQFNRCHGNIQVLSNLPKVGEIK